MMKGTSSKKVCIGRSESIFAIFKIMILIYKIFFIMKHSTNPTSHWAAERQSRFLGWGNCTSCLHKIWNFGMEIKFVRASEV